MKTCRAVMFYSLVLPILFIGFPLSFHYVVGVYIYFITHAAVNLSLIPGTIPVLDLTEKFIFTLSRYLQLRFLIKIEASFTNCFSISNIACIAASKPRPPAILVTASATTDQFYNEFSKFISIFKKIQGGIPIFCSMPTGILSNYVPSDLNFKLAGSILKACRSFSNENDLTCVYDL